MDEISPMGFFLFTTGAGRRLEPFNRSTSSLYGP